MKFLEFFTGNPQNKNKIKTDDAFLEKLSEKIYFFRNLSNNSLRNFWRKHRGNIWQNPYRNKWRNFRKNLTETSGEIAWKFVVGILSESWRIFQRNLRIQGRILARINTKFLKKWQLSEKYLQYSKTVLQNFIRLSSIQQIFCFRTEKTAINDQKCSCIITYWFETGLQKQ